MGTFSLADFEKGGVGLAKAATNPAQLKGLLAGDGGAGKKDEADDGDDSDPFGDMDSDDDDDDWAKDSSGPAGGKAPLALKLGGAGGGKAEDGAGEGSDDGMSGFDTSSGDDGATGGGGGGGGDSAGKPPAASSGKGGGDSDGETERPAVREPPTDGGDDDDWDDIELPESGQQLNLHKSYSERPNDLDSIEPIGGHGKTDLTTTDTDGGGLTDEPLDPPVELDWPEVPPGALDPGRLRTLISRKKTGEV